MTPDSPTSRLAQVRERILARSEATLSELRHLLSAPEMTAEDREQAYILVHNLSGVAGSVGLPDVGTKAKALENLIAPWLRHAAARPDWSAAFDALNQALSTAREAH